jgi:hypothetical protein
VQASVNENVDVVEEVVGRTLMMMVRDSASVWLPGCAAESTALADVGGPDSESVRGKVDVVV